MDNKNIESVQESVDIVMRQEVLRLAIEEARTKMSATICDCIGRPVDV